ncbi:HNH endonuclease [Gemmobacter aquatilis]|uniref:HNH endonuclease n=1 Tax=Gemmobacter aquatilis TaxID=933059 RepID=A0A1H7ZMC0_9RHOB|nr:HNH endonuclease [Gemmobacter aquatilis]SEM59712.1 HNH endonuclease [Gemmobacter aquatilis]
MPTDLKSASLLEISQELTRFNYELRGLFRCPTCLCDYPINSKEITEEHIIPDSNGGRITTFLCKKCNSLFGHKQTRWLSDWIELSESNTPFHVDPKKQRAQLMASGLKLNGVIKIAEDGAIEFQADKKRSNPIDFEAYWSRPKSSEITIKMQVSVFGNENSLRVGFLTAAYGLWFKNFGYSFVLQSSLNVVRQQILNPETDIMNWNYLIEMPAREIANPCIGLMRFGVDYFPIALIYDQLVILPSPKRPHPSSTSPSKMSKKVIGFAEAIASRYQHRCVGPAVLICDGQEVINPDLIPNATIPPQYSWVDRWD